MKLSVLFLLIGGMHVFAAGNAQNITLKGKNLPLEKVFAEIKKQSRLNFLYSIEDIEHVRPLNASFENMPLKDAMEIVLKDAALSFQILDDVVVIKKKERIASEDFYVDNLKITGKVTDASGEPIFGASVMVLGTKIGITTNKEGVFSLEYNREEFTIVVTNVGYKSQSVKVTGGKLLHIVLEAETEKLEDVVVSNGMFNRRIESFTGAVATFTGEQLKAVSNQSPLKALAILDPSFQIVDNLELGSDPNRLPEIQLRGQTGFPDLKGDFTTNPNQPLFILDGFETTLEKVNDLNLNLIKSITLLKDASAKAIWGSKAGNGVVVIETKTPSAGKLRISYNGSLDITAPDLSSYELTNSLQKVQAEVLGGIYNAANPATQAELLRLYAANQKAALDGVNTYWLSQPLRNGIGQRHAINLDGGEDAMRYSVNLNYNNIAGVMKGSDRNTLSGMFNLIYRTGNFQFRNSLTIDNNRSDNSPYGSYSNTSRLNPYWRIKDDNGNFLKTLGPNNVGNPIYDGSLNSKDFSTYTTITENFYTDWTPINNLRFTARVGIIAQKNDAEKFTPANHSMYANISPIMDTYIDRGEYNINNGKLNTINADILANYSLQLNGHHFFINGGYSITQNKTSSNGMTMVGFPNDKMDDISFGNRYKDGTKAAGSENTSRSLALTSAVNYSYDDRLLADLSLRSNASSQFGADKRWGLFWSAGLGWNLHRENFVKNVSAINLLKLRVSTGITGTQNFNSYQSLATYNYITNETYNGDMGLNLLALPNPGLQWQLVMDNNAGVDVGLFNKLNLRFDYYVRDTRNLLNDMIVAPSSGFSTYKENIGESRNEGFQLGVNYRVYTRSSTRTSVNVFVNVARNTNRIRKVSNSLLQLNASQDTDKGTVTTGNADTRKPSTRFEPSQSMSAIWVVHSLGIDPANGREIFRKKDGTLTYDWSASDYIVAGDETPSYLGTFGASMQHKGFGVNMNFSFRTGGQLYNSTLVNRVENADFNYNVDIRALEERWRKPGDVTLYKNIADRTDTRPTSRFVQDLHELLLSSFSVTYDLSQSSWIKRMNLNGLSFGLNLNDLARFSSVKTERGLDYPFARTISTTFNVTF